MSLTLEQIRAKLETMPPEDRDTIREIMREAQASIDPVRRPGLAADCANYLAVLNQMDAPPDQAATHPLIAVTDGWLECFQYDPDAERGVIICPVEPGDNWWELAAKVDAHITQHGCGQEKTS